MGNNPSTSKPATPVSGQDSPRTAQRNRHPHPIHNQRAAAPPPEPSLAQAKGSVARPKSMPPLPRDNTSSTSSSLNSATRPTDIARPRPGAAAAPGAADREVRSKPVAVPNSQPNQPTSPLGPYSPDSAVDAAAGMQPLGSMQDISYLTRPPRMPLPIEEEIHTPGSPILAPRDTGEPVGDVEHLDSDGLTRKSSGLSTTTVDEDDAEELIVDKNHPTVPTRLEWLRGGKNVYVTGTIFQWNRKQRLHPVDGQPGAMAATVHILPGTHHVRFLVDGQMQTSPDLPTTVDFGNNLVNYIEVSPDDVQTGTTSPSGDVAVENDEQQPLARPAPSQLDEKLKTPKEKPVVPASGFRYEIPKYLVDFDQPEESPAYQSAVNAIDKLPSPPSLPGFLGRPILNAAVLMKDDNSVLNMPNHTILNHLATSSIKNNVLAVSATTRYKSKYVTTIVYKPTGGDEKDDK